LGRTELSRVVEIDRTERINVLYDQHGTQLVTRPATAAPWPRTRMARVSTPSRQRLVDIGVVMPHLRSGIAQLTFLHVSAPLRATGIGSRLSKQLEQIAGDVQ
jgi:hypothetical protein